ncbi:MAG: pyridoxal 5'-phosphate synthase glutaminase subunit PdxT [Candidatus Zixiibacteriota bacterium]
MKNYANIKIGVLALQGDFERHHHQLVSLGVDVTLVRLPIDLEHIHGLIIPGGESTTMDNLIDRFNLRTPLTDFGKAKPVWGTCAGMIMLAKDIKDNQAGVEPLGLMDIDVVRMGYGRQVFSFEDNLKANLNGTVANLKATFIRAPMITRVGHSVKTLAEYDGVPVLVTEKNLMASSFHTELDDDTTLLRYFLQKFFQL